MILLTILNFLVLYIPLYLVTGGIITGIYIDLFAAKVNFTDKERVILVLLWPICFLLVYRYTQIKQKEL